MKKLIVAPFILLFTIYSTSATAQTYFYNDSYYDSPLLFEVGGSVNAMNCFTDLGGKKGIGKKFIKDLNFGKTGIAGGIFFNAIYQNKIALRVEATFGKLSADDAVLSGITDIAKERFNRNLSFRTTLREVSVLAEIHPLMFIDWEDRDQDPPRLSPYIVGGVGFFSFNPQTKLGNRWVDLQPLSTEGQGFPEYPGRKVYKLQQMNIPLGAGVKYELSSLLNLRGEFLYRVLNTDYLDDVSTRYVDPAAFSANGFTGTRLANAIALSDRQLDKRTGPGGKRGSPEENDAYFSFNVKLSLTLGRQHR
jgi:hypothetical protein